MPNALSLISTASPETVGFHQRPSDRKSDTETVFADVMNNAEASEEASPGPNVDDEDAVATDARPNTPTTEPVVSEAGWRESETAESDIMPAHRMRAHSDTPISVVAAIPDSNSGGAEPNRTSARPTLPGTVAQDVGRDAAPAPTNQFSALSNSTDEIPPSLSGPTAEPTSKISHQQVAFALAGQKSIEMPGPGNRQKPEDPPRSRQFETELVGRATKTEMRLPDTTAPPSGISAEFQPRLPDTVDAFAMDDASSGEEAVDPVGPQDTGSLRSARDPIGTFPVSGAAARAEVARAIAGQMAAAITSKPGSGRVEIALNPEELGKVSIVLTGREDGLHLVLSAERPETLDLMRRHIGILSAELQDMGFADLSFDLGTSSDEHQNETRPVHTAFLDPEGLDNSEAGRERQLRAAPLRALDLRL
ncbi:putative flagellar hook-length control protein [Ruegeria lacuscaerulensis ITI-1157]|nr:putative flagellar hook-length control protein [Ruegeria lacuscaerulensis ITI-1157]SHJ57730.1 hook-length control protein FliK [Ruegeria lacuscaerulensis ITI-1157]